MPGMALERFAELAAAYGGDFERWPEAERFAAVSLAGRSGEARSLLAGAHGLDYLLSRLGAPPAPSDALMRRVAALEPESGGAESPAPARRGPVAALRSNALMLSVLLNVVLAGALSGVWIGSRPAPGAASEAAYMEAVLSDEDEAGLDGEPESPIPSDTDLVEFDAEPDDVDLAGWPNGDPLSIYGISSI